MVTFFDGYDGLLCDLDGVVYAGPSSIQNAVSTLNSLQESSIPVAFVTNNASKSAAEVSDRLTQLGVRTTPEHVMTSAQAVVNLLRQKYEAHHGPVLVTGAPQLATQIRNAGYQTTSTAQDQPQVVVQGFNPNLGWRDLAEASFAIQQGAGWLATNLDLTIPLQHGVAPGNGSLVRAVSQATGTQPEVAAGKPAPVMFATMAQTFDMRRPLVVGDRLDTDVLGAHNAGFHGALVLTGIHRTSDLPTFQDLVTPEWILPDLSVLLAEPLDEYRGRNE